MLIVFRVSNVLALKWRKLGLKNTNTASERVMLSHEVHYLTECTNHNLDAEKNTIIVSISLSTHSFSHSGEANGTVESLKSSHHIP